jgi:hypothetical protein
MSLLAQDDREGNNGIVQNRGNSGCISAPIYFNQTIPVCDSTTLDNFCLQMTDSLDYQPHQWPGCQGITLHNPNWITFIAGSDQLQMEIEILDCNKGRGIQIGIYRLPKEMDYGPDQAPLNPAPSMIGSSITGCFYAETPQQETIKFTTGTTPGQLFGILIDGWNGDLCQVQLNLKKGATAPAMSSEIEGAIEYADEDFNFKEDTVCQGAQDVEFSLSQAVEGAYTYIWTVDGEKVPAHTVYPYRANISLEKEGIAEVCVAASNHCDTTEAVCVQVPVKPLYTLQTVDTICEGDEYAWQLEGGNINELYGPFTNYSGDTLMSAYFHESTQNCRINGNLDLHVRNENNENPYMLDTFVSFTDLPVEIMDHNITRPVNNHLIHTVSEETACDEYYQLDLTVLGGKYFVGMRCNGSEGGTFYFDGFDDPNFYSPWEDQFEYIENREELELEYSWTAEGSTEIIGNRNELYLDREQLLSYAKEGIGKLRLDVQIKYKNQVIVDITAPPYEYEMDVHFPSANKIDLLNDTVLVTQEIASSYQWLNCDKEFQLIDGANHQTFQPKEEGNYAVTINDKFCSDTTECVYFKLESEDSENGDLLIVPNPVDNEFKVHFLPISLAGSDYYIYTASGREVGSGTINDNGIFNVNNLFEGVYYLKLPNAVLKFVKL